MPENVLNCNMIWCIYIWNNATCSIMILYNTVMHHNMKWYDNHHCTYFMFCYVLQWGFHSLWISADLKRCWTIRVTSTSTRRKASRLASGRSLVVSSFVHSSASVLENTTGGSRVDRMAVSSSSSPAQDQSENPSVYNTSVFVVLEVSPLSLAIFVS